MNKYAKIAKKLAEERRQERMCLKKWAYETEAEAFQKGQRTYNCPICKKWHRSGALASFVARIRRRNP